MDFGNIVELQDCEPFFSVTAGWGIAITARQYHLLKKKSSLNYTTLYILSSDSSLYLGNQTLGE